MQQVLSILAMVAYVAVMVALARVKGGAINTGWLWS